LGRRRLRRMGTEAVIIRVTERVRNAHGHLSQRRVSTGVKLASGISISRSMVHADNVVLIVDESVGTRILWTLNGVLDLHHLSLDGPNQIGSA
jgi:hypothetical protein